MKGTIESLAAAAKRTRIRVLSDKETFPPHIAKILQLRKTKNVFQLELVRFIPKGLLGYSFIYFPFSLGKIISSNELDETTETITFVEEKLNTKVYHTKQAIDVGVADKVFAENPAAKPNTSLLIIEQNYYTRKG